MLLSSAEGFCLPAPGVESGKGSEIVHTYVGIALVCLQEFKAACEMDPSLDSAREGLALAYTEIGTRLKLCGQNEVSPPSITFQLITQSCTALP